MSLYPRCCKRKRQRVVDNTEEERLSAGEDNTEEERLSVHERRLKAYFEFRSCGCEICGMWHPHEVVPFQKCMFCFSVPSFHHPHCCPDR